MLRVPCKFECGVKTRRLLALSYWPAPQRPMQDSHFVILGLCWLDARGEFPPNFPLHGRKKVVAPI